METILRTIKLTDDAKKNILEDLLKRSPNSYGEYEGIVNEILENVRTNKDKAVFEYTKKFYISAYIKIFVDIIYKNLQK